LNLLRGVLAVAVADREVDARHLGEDEVGPEGHPAHLVGEGGPPRVDLVVTADHRGDSESLADGSVEATGAAIGIGLAVLLKDDPRGWSSYRLRNTSVTEIVLEPAPAILAFDLVDARDIEDSFPAFLPDRLRGLLRNDAERRHGVGGMPLDLVPDTEPGLRLPDRGHLGAGIAGDHRRSLGQRAVASGSFGSGYRAENSE